MNLIPDMPAAEYHALPHFSQSRAKAILRSPAHCKWEMDNPTPPSDSMRLGTALHHMLLTPAMPFPLGVMPDGLDRRTKEGKAAYADLSAQFGDEIISAADMAQAQRMADAVLAHKDAAWLIQHATHREATAAYQLDGVKCKSRFDGILPDAGIIIDIKTTTDASRDAFQRSILNFGYHVQAALYLEAAAICGHPIDDFCIIAVENCKSGYCGVAVYRIDDEAVAVGREEMRKALALWRECHRTGEWPGYSQEITPIGLPRWAYAQALAEVA